MLRVVTILSLLWTIGHVRAEDAAPTPTIAPIPTPLPLPGEQAAMHGCTADQGTPRIVVSGADTEFGAFKIFECRYRVTPGEAPPPLPTWLSVLLDGAQLWWIDQAGAESDDPLAEKPTESIELLLTQKPIKDWGASTHYRVVPGPRGLTLKRFGSICNTPDCRQPESPRIADFFVSPLPRGEALSILSTVTPVPTIPPPPVPSPRRR